MRFMYIVTSSQPDDGPTPALMEAMGKLADREIKAGRMIDSGGLLPVVDRARRCGSPTASSAWSTGRSSRPRR